MTNVLLVILIVLIGWDKIPKKKEKPIIDERSEQEKKRQKELQDEFNNMMDYSINDAIESKKVSE